MVLFPPALALEGGFLEPKARRQGLLLVRGPWREPILTPEHTGLLAGGPWATVDVRPGHLSPRPWGGLHVDTQARMGSLWHRFGPLLHRVFLWPDIEPWRIV